MWLVDSRDVYHCPFIFSQSTDFSAPLRSIASFGVGVYVSIVAGGSVTTYNLNIKPFSTTGFQTQFPDNFDEGISQGAKNLGKCLAGNGYKC